VGIEAGKGLVDSLELIARIVIGHVMEAEVVLWERQQ
jgi:hypothetical protein